MCDMRLCIGVIVPLHDSVCRRLFVVSTRRQHEIQLALLTRTIFLLVGAQHHCVHISARKPCATYGMTIDRTPYTALTVRLCNQRIRRRRSHFGRVCVMERARACRCTSGMRIPPPCVLPALANHTPPTSTRDVLATATATTARLSPLIVS